MAWYREADYEQIPAYNRSFIVALANLVQHLDAGDYNPLVLNNLLTSDDPYLDWLVLPEYVKTVTLGEIHDDDPQWPVQNGAIVKFRRIDFESGNELDHYCLVIDARQMAIVDSLDGIIKHGASYGPVHAWATYQKTPEAVKDELTAAIEEKRAYVIGPDENIWDAARKLNQKVAVLMEYNGIGDPRKVKEGYVVNIPPSEYVEKKNVEYVAYPEIVTKRVIKPGGATKYAFGNARNWSDIREVGRVYKEGSILAIAGEAHVFLDDEEEETEALYYMERLDMGRYRDTGLVSFTVGLNHSQLADADEDYEVVNGAAEVQTGVTEPLNEPQVIEETAQVLEAEEEIVEEPITIDEQIEETLGENLSNKPFVELIEEDGAAKTYLVTEPVYVNELEGKRAPKLLRQNQLISLTYKKEVNDLLFYVPGLPYDEHNLTFLVPANKVMLEEELFDSTMSVVEKVRSGMSLTLDERVFAVLSRILSRSVTLKAWISKHK